MEKHEGTCKAMQTFPTTGLGKQLLGMVGKCTGVRALGVPTAEVAPCQDGAQPAQGFGCSVPASYESVESQLG